MGLCRAASPSPTASSRDAFLAPTLFYIFFSIMLREGKDDLPDGTYIRFRTDGSLFNLRRHLARTKTIEELITELPFADDCALLAHTEEALQHIVDRFSHTAKNGECWNVRHSWTKNPPGKDQTCQGKIMIQEASHSERKRAGRSPGLQVPRQFHLSR